MGAQTLLVLGAIVLTALLAVAINWSISSSNDSTYQASVIVSANQLGKELIDEISSKEFDQNTTAGKFVANPAGFSNIGKDAGESSRAAFNDVDDYNNYTDSVTTGAGKLKYSIVVTYAAVDTLTPSSSSPDTPSGSKTRMKKITVSITAPDYQKTFFKDTIKFCYYKCY